MDVAADDILSLGEGRDGEQPMGRLGRDGEQAGAGGADHRLPCLGDHGPRDQLAAGGALLQRLVVGLVVGEARALLVEVEGRGVLRAVEERQGIPAFVGMRPPLDGRLQGGEPALDGAHVHSGQLGQAVGGFEAHGSRCVTWTCWR